MTTQCSRFCSYVSQHISDYDAIRAHILSGSRCPDAWLALARMVKTPQQQLDCLRYAAQIDPDDIDLQITYYERLTTMSPDDADGQGKLRQLRAYRVVRSARPRAMLRREPPRTIGRILLEMDVIESSELMNALREQRARKDRGENIQLGELLIQRKKILPALLARALTIQFQERQECGHGPTMVGEYLVRDGLLSLHSLELALLEQIRQSQLGKRESLGRILMRYGVISWAQLKEVLDRQEHDAMASYI
jgi:hypothetical protein